MARPVDEISNARNPPALQLFKELDEDLRRDPTGPNVKRLMAEYIAKYNDWQEYVNFCEHKYARNLIKSNDVLELMVICWLPHQVSPIHNHAAQRCWAAVLEGTVKETQFLFQNTHSTTGSGPLEECSNLQVKAGEVGFISDDIALHVLQPMDGKRGITMHLYSKPICECNIYCSKTGTITKRKTGFFTINKQLQEQTCAPCTPTAATTCTISAAAPSCAPCTPTSTSAALTSTPLSASSQ